MLLKLVLGAMALVCLLLLVACGYFFWVLLSNRWRYRHLPGPKTKRYLVSLMYQYNKSVEELITYLTPKADGNTNNKILMAEEFNKVAMDIIAKVAFGLDDLNVIERDDSPFCGAAAQIMAGIWAAAQNPFMSGKVQKFQKADREAIDLVRETGKKCILQRIQDIQDGRNYPKDILTHIIQASSAMKMDYDMENMIDDFVTFFEAGLLQTEVDTVMGTNGTISYEDTCKLKYMTLVLKEVLRYTPPVPAIGRVATRDLVANGYKIPAGTDILMNHYAMGRDDRFFDEPDKFDPERFSETSNKRSFAYFPFSLGPRICIGQHFPMIEAKVIIAKLLQTFDFTLVPGVELEFLQALTLKSKHRTPVYLTHRKSHPA